MRKNGKVRFRMTSGDTAQFDSIGLPVEAEVVWTDYTPCLVQRNTDNRRGQYQDGVFRALSLSVLIEAGQFALTDDAEATYMEVLLDHEQEARGFDIISVTHRPELGTVQIDA